MRDTDYLACVRACDHYIEMHPGERISAQDLAEVNGYSLSHFSLLFHAFTDMPLSTYVRSSRLRRAAAAIAQGTPVTQAALDAGFDTNAGFNKAFRRLYGISPQEYRRRIRGGVSGLLPAPRLVHLDRQQGIGYKIPGKRLSAKEAAWKDVDFSKLPPYPEGMRDDGEIGLWLDPDPETGELTYFFGMLAGADTAITAVPQGFSPLVLNAGAYAVYRVSETVWTDDADTTASKVSEAWKLIFMQGITASGNNGAQIHYDESRHPFEFYRGSRALICIPIVRKSDM